MRISDWSSDVCSSDLAPPFGRFAAIVVSSGKPEDAQETARLIGKAAPKMEGMSVYGPAPAPLAVLRGRHRHRLLIHARRALDVQDVIREWPGGLTWPGSTRVSVDVDPYSWIGRAAWRERGVRNV